MPTQPAPIVLEPSGEFLGVDGAWSPFFVKVGSPPTKLRLLASTQIPESWVVLPLGCPNDVLNCSDARGGTFDPKGSKTWQEKGTLPLGSEYNLGFSAANFDNGDYGFDTVQLGLPGQGNASLEHQLIAGIATNDFWVGNLGLASRNLIFPDNSQASGLLSQLRSNNLIPSLSYGFTAGASYLKRNASLTLGGFDSSKFTPNQVSFDMDQSNPQRSTIVALQSIVLADSKSSGTPLLTTPLITLVDSTVPHIWLPTEICQVFEKVFDLNYDSITNLYLVNDTLHNALLKQNPSIIFQLSNSLTGGPAINITLPYASFDLTLQVGYPSVQKPSRYFPLRRGDGKQYTLGRTFLQESYLIVDYERGNFSISQSVGSSESPSHIVPITPFEVPTSTPSSTVPPFIKSTSQPSQSTSAAASNSSSLGTPAIAGIAVAIVLVILAAGAIGFWLRNKRMRKKDVPECLPYSNFPQNTAELGIYDRNQTNEKAPGLLVTEASDEKIHNEIDQNEMKIVNPGNDLGRAIPFELGGSGLLNPSELPIPDPFMGHELSSSEAEIMRSELSTPEPGWPAEMPSPEVSSEVDDTARGEPSPNITPPPIFWSGDGTVSRRPTHTRMDSSEAEAGWSRVGNPLQPARQGPHSRLSSTASTDSQSQPGWDSDRHPPAATPGQRPQRARLDSSDTESGGFPRANLASARRPKHGRTDSADSEAFMTPPRRHSLQHHRPSHRRLDSKDSAETLETRMELSPPISPYLPPPVRSSRDRPIEALPSIWPSDSEETLISPNRASMRSALRSPEPFQTDFREEPEDISETRDLIEEADEDDEQGGGEKWIGISEEPGLIAPEEEAEVLPPPTSSSKPEVETGKAKNRSSDAPPKGQ